MLFCLQSTNTFSSNLCLPHASETIFFHTLPKPGLCVSPEIVLDDTSDPDIREENMVVTRITYVKHLLRGMTSSRID